VEGERSKVEGRDSVDALMALGTRLFASVSIRKGPLFILLAQHTKARRVCVFVNRQGTLKLQEFPRLLQLYSSIICKHQSLGFNWHSKPSFDV
jgi:hypothetical protein